MAEFDIDAISTVVGQAPQTPDAVKIKPTLLNIDEVSTVAPESSMLDTMKQFAGGFNELLFYYPDKSNFGSMISETISALIFYFDWL